MIKRYIEKTGRNIEVLGDYETNHMNYSYLF